MLMFIYTACQEISQLIAHYNRLYT